MTGYLVYDVFTDRPFGGNPLAIFPEAAGLPEALLQKIAREFNFSETVFVLPPRDPGHHARLRIFTPTQEVPFAGHPTIGTAVALHDLGGPAAMVLELGVGPIACEAGERVGAQFGAGRARFTTARPLERLHAVDAGTVAACLGLDPGCIRSDRHAPVMASVGLPFVFAELEDRAALARAAPVAAAFRAGALRYPAPLDFAVAPYVRDAGGVAMRMFAPLDDIPEDPATGSAAAALAALLASDEGAAVVLDIAQGVEMGRPSRIRASTGPGGVTIEGAAVKVMEGRLML